MLPFGIKAVYIINLVTGSLVVSRFPLPNSRYYHDIYTLFSYIHNPLPSYLNKVIGIVSPTLSQDIDVEQHLP